MTALWAPDPRKNSAKQHKCLPMNSIRWTMLSQAQEAV